MLSSIVWQDVTEGGNSDTDTSRVMGCREIFRAGRGVIKPISTMSLI